MEPFLQNHQYNRIAQQAKMLLSALQTSNDRKVVEAARHSAVTRAVEARPGMSGEELRLVERLADLRSTEEFQTYLAELSDHTIAFPEMTESKLKGLFPKVKKLRMPDMARIEGRPLTYLGWTDPGTNRLFLVYARTRPTEPGGKEAGGLIGIEGRFTAANKKGVCAFCNRTGEMALFTAVSKTKLSHLPDYYKAVGQYICLDSDVCNSQITDLDALERFFDAVTR